MQKYLFIHRTPTDAPATSASPEEMQGMLSTWSRWKEKFSRQVTDIGDGLKPGGLQVLGGVVTDGAFIESKEVIGGYSIITASGYPEALEVARECPIALMPGARIEIRELAGY